MKKNIFKSLLLTAVVSTVGIGSVCAATTNYEEQPTSASDYKITFAIEGKNDVAAHAQLEIEGLKSVSAYSDYYVKFVEKDASKPDEIKGLANINTSSSTPEMDRFRPLGKKESGKIVANANDLLYLYNKDYYVYIYNCTKTVDYTTYCQVTTDTPIRVEKESIPNLTQRYQYYFFGNTDSNVVNPHLAVFPLFPASSSYVEGVKLNVKVGIIEDSSIIRGMARKESDAIQNLYDYAKNATNGKIYSEEFSNFRNADTSDLSVQNGKYYYLYFDIDDKTNQYIDVSDVSIVMGKSGMLVNDVTYDSEYDANIIDNYEYGCYACTNDYVWTVKGYQASTCQLVDSITSKGNCVKSVKTGVEDYLVPGAIVMVVGGAIVTLLNRKTKFKRI